MVAQPLEVLLVSKGSFEGKHVRDTISSQLPKNHAVHIVDVPLLLDGKSQSSVITEVSEKIEGKSFHSVIIVLSLPVRATPEAQKHLSTITKIFGKKLDTNGILLFTNGSHMNRNPGQFQEFLDREIEASKQDYYVSLGKLISTVPRNHCLLYDLNAHLSSDRINQNENLFNIVRTLPAFTYTRWSLRDVNKKPLWFLLVGLLVTLALKYAFKMHNEKYHLQLEVIQKNETINRLTKEELRKESYITQLKSDVNESNDKIIKNGLEIATLRTDLGNKEIDLLNSHSQLNHSKQLIEHNQGTIANLNSDLMKSRSEIKQINERIHINSKEIERLNVDLQTKQSSLDQSHSQLRDREQQLQQKDGDIENLKQNIKTNLEEIERLKKEIEAQRVEIEKLQYKIKEKDEIIKKLTSEINVKDNETMGLKSSIAVHKNTITDLENKIGEKDMFVKYQRKIIQGFKRNIAMKHAVIGTLQFNISSQLKVNERTSRELHEKVNEVTGKDEQINELKQTINTKDEYIKNLEKEIADVTQSLNSRIKQLETELEQEEDESLYDEEHPGQHDMYANPTKKYEPGRKKESCVKGDCGTISRKKSTRKSSWAWFWSLWKSEP